MERTWSVIQLMANVHAGQVIEGAIAVETATMDRLDQTAGRNVNARMEELVTKMTDPVLVQMVFLVVFVTYHALREHLDATVQNDVVVRMAVLATM